jgi:4-diphosphocytidyl-2-C-methyl-D-erythritol kinase
MPINMPKLTVSAPAKVNLHLAVKDRRQDGFHNLESVFLALDFGDTLHFEPADGGNTEIDMEGLNFSLHVKKNIIFKALSLFRAETGFNQDFRIRVEKRIPSGGGLGGGSSDAAAALLALNKLAGFPLSLDTLLKTAALLGSDVPFFLYETAAAWVTGRGEHIEPLEAPCLFFVLVNPGFSSGTAAAFRLLDEYRGKKASELNTELHGNTRQANAPEQAGAFFEKTLHGAGLEKSFFTEMSQAAVLPQEPAAWLFWNDFLPVLNEREKFAYSEINSALRELGAEFANLSGAGSTCFGVFKEKTSAEKAAASLRICGKWDYVECASTRMGNGGSG